LNNITVTEFKDIRVLTTLQIAEQYDTDMDTINRNFNNNKERYTEGKHYILLQGQELKEAKTSGKFYGLSAKVNKFYLWTEKGCLLQAKSLGTDKAWETYENLVDTYFTAKDIFAGLTEEMKVLLSHDKKIKIVLDHIAETDTRVDNLENNMTIDYGQQKALERLVNITVVNALGGKDTPAYDEIAKKVFKECNRDIQDRFNVNSRNNVPKLRYEEACTYIKNWQPCTNTKILINDTNNQLTLNTK
jgi:hypothetical protein